MTLCRDCTTGILHCHGSLVAHLDGTFACTDCDDAAPATHDARIECTDPCCATDAPRMAHAA